MNTSSNENEGKIEFVDVMINSIKDEKNWCQGTLARNKHGISVLAEGESAVAWCLAGSIFKAAKLLPEYKTEIRYDISKLLPDGIANFNDTSPHKEVMNFLNDYRTSLINNGDCYEHRNH